MDQKTKQDNVIQDSSSSDPKIELLADYWKQLLECVKSKNPAMFEVYKRIGWHDALNRNVTSPEDLDKMFELDEKLFEKMKDIITKLVEAKPADRMKLKETREKLVALNSMDVLGKIDDFLLLKRR